MLCVTYHNKKVLTDIATLTSKRLEHWTLPPLVHRGRLGSAQCFEPTAGPGGLQWWHRGPWWIWENSRSSVSSVTTRPGFRSERGIPRRGGLSRLSLRPQLGSDSSSCPTKQPCAEPQPDTTLSCCWGFLWGRAWGRPEGPNSRGSVTWIVADDCKFVVKGDQSSAPYFASGGKGQALGGLATSLGVEIAKYWHRFFWKAGESLMSP